MNCYEEEITLHLGNNEITLNTKDVKEKIKHEQEVNDNVNAFLYKSGIVILPLCAGFIALEIKASVGFKDVIKKEFKNNYEKDKLNKVYKK